MRSAAPCWTHATCWNARSQCCGRCARRSACRPARKCCAGRPGRGNVAGRLTHRDEAAVSPFDSAVQGGDAVWEGAAVLELAAADGLPCVVGDHSLTQFYAADEVFVTGTMGGLAAVTRLDGRVIGSGAPGPVTRRLTDLYAGLTATSGTPVA